MILEADSGFSRGVTVSRIPSRNCPAKPLGGGFFFFSVYLRDAVVTSLVRVIFESS